MNIKKLLVRILQIVLIVVIVYCGWQIGSYFYNRKRSDEDFEKVASIADSYVISKDSEESSEDLPKEKEIDYKALMSRLQDQNSDCIAYIIIDGTENKYPVVQSANNDYYLRRGFDKKHSMQGIPFADYRNKKDLTDQNTIIYGHTMYTGTVMFGILNKYFDQEFADKMPKTVTLVAPHGVFHYQIFSIAHVDADYDYRQPNLDGNKMVAHMNEMLKKSETDMGYKGEFKESDHFITLSTCPTNQDLTKRVAVVGVLQKIDTKDGEMPKGFEK